MQRVCQKKGLKQKELSDHGRIAFYKNESKTFASFLWSCLTREPSKITSPKTYSNLLRDKTIPEKSTNSEPSFLYLLRTLWLGFFVFRKTKSKIFFPTYFSISFTKFSAPKPSVSPNFVIKLQ